MLPLSAYVPKHGTEKKITAAFRFKTYEACLLLEGIQIILTLFYTFFCFSSV